MHIHPFPARMAPEIALRVVEQLPKEARVLDPMTGSGMVLQQCAKLGIHASGRDLDPLACLISRTATTKIDPVTVRAAARKLVTAAKKISGSDIELPWIDNDLETVRFIRYWFAPFQRDALRRLSYLLFQKRIFAEPKIVDILAVAVSRLIVTKEPKASRARDTAHSRPHRTLDRNTFDVLENVEKSVEHVLKALEASAIRRNAHVRMGDARRLDYVRSGSIDAVITSPPYLNAIDYMRGHRLSLVWLGHSLSSLQSIRATTIGAEVSLNIDDDEFDEVSDRLGFHRLDNRLQAILRRYYSDLRDQLAATTRVLKTGGLASYTIGNCNVRGVYVRNNVLLRECALSAGLELVEERQRRIPTVRRYLPVKGQTTALAARMRTEHVLQFRK
ncbi:MAG: hypothetical protein EOP84_02860 [Verrucomicrobiaceae bacterium]|nr:MAG: hypothetical protein EOP84_02860 [Verrucomicrobiaceae bacterium]